MARRAAPTMRRYIYVARKVQRCKINLFAISLSPQGRCTAPATATANDGKQYATRYRQAPRLQRTSRVRRGGVSVVLVVLLVRLGRISRCWCVHHDAQRRASSVSRSPSLFFSWLGLFHTCATRAREFVRRGVGWGGSYLYCAWCAYVLLLGGEVETSTQILNRHDAAALDCHSALLPRSSIIRPPHGTIGPFLHK